LQFSTTAVNVLVMMAYAVPGIILIKIKSIGQESIGAFAKILLYVCQPCLSIYSFNKANYTPELWKSMIIFFFMSILLQLIMLGLMYIIFKKKYQKDASYRVCTIATILGNVGFLGVPLLEALLPDQPNAIAFSAVFILGMNIISWTIASTILTGEKKHMSIKKVLINPAMIAMIISLPLFLTSTKLPDEIGNNVEVLGKMTTPMSMLILGMRLALADFKELFKDFKVYIVSALKLIVFPIIGMAVVYFLPVEQYIKATMIILCCCPTASTVLNLSELYSTGQKTAAKLVLTSTLFCIITIPFLLMFVNPG